RSTSSASWEKNRCDTMAKSPSHGGEMGVFYLIFWRRNYPHDRGTRPAHPPVPESAAEEVVTQLFRHTRSLLTLKGRPPFRLAGIETSERLDHVARCSLEWLAQRYEPRLAQVYQGLQAALAPFAQTHQELQPGAAWLRDIAYPLEPVPSHPIHAEYIAGQLRDYLDTVRRWPQATPTLSQFALHLDTVSRSYWSGLFH